jgi:hypothetical protein
MRRFAQSACLGAILASLLATVPADAKSRLPTDALSRVRYPDNDARVGYGAVDPCRACGYLYAPWSGLEPYVLEGSATGRLRVAQIAGSAVRLSTYGTVTYRRASIHVLTFPGWKVGGVLMAPDGFTYVMVGRSNPQQDDARVVIEVHKYDGGLRDVGVAQISGGLDGHGIYSPFDATESSMALAGTTLVVHTARLIYHIAGDSAPHHQVNLSFSVDTGTMAAQLAEPAPYSSHSFRQFVRVQGGDDAVYLDHGDAYPRAIQVGVVPDYFAPAHGATPVPGCVPEDPVYTADCIQTPEPRTFDVWHFDGETGDNYTGTTVNGFEVGATHALATGLSVPHERAVQGVTGSARRLVRNAYLISTDTMTGASRFVWMTAYRPTSAKSSLSQPQLVPLGNDRFAVLFTTKLGTTTRIQYRVVDEAGDVLATQTWNGRQFSALGPPVAIGSKLFWVGYAHSDAGRSRGGGHYLYALGIANALRPRLITG